MRTFLIVMLLSMPVLANNDAKDLANGIIRWKAVSQNGLWYSCGARVEDQPSVAYHWASAVVEASRRHSLNFWGLAAIIDKESGWDECAIGKKARDFGIRAGLIKRRSITISVTREEVLHVLEKYERAVDLGPGQLMYRSVYRGNVADLMSVLPGVEIVAKELAKRANGIRPYNAKLASTPWYMWPGGVSQAYGKKIEFRMKKLGAL